MSRRSRARAPRIEVDLMMECCDDELSPWQQEANKKAEAEYRDALSRIQAAKAGALAMSVSHATPVTVTTAERPAPADSPDVIIVDETPAPRNNARKTTPTPTSKSGAASKVGKSGQAVQQMLFSPGIGPGGQPILLPNQPFGGQYQIIQTMGGQAQIISRPVSGQQGGQVVTNVIRSPAGIPVQRVHAQPRKQPVTLRNVHGMEMMPVAGTFGLGVKRTSPIGGAIEPSKKRQAVRQSTEKDEAGNWVPLDEYYYGKKEGDPAYTEEKAEFRFKCWYCHKMLYNNLRIMMHMQGHIDSEKQQNLDLSDLTQCKHCYKQFDTPFEMQCHIEKVHQNQSNVLVCRICEKDHDSQAGLRTHMRTYHNACEMPYICQLCNFRSSIFSDVVDHFKKRHDSSQYVMCLYCLRVFKVNFSKSSGWGLTQNYYQHLQKHQLKNSCRKCPCCKLTFVNKADAKLHRGKDHLPNYKGILGGGAGTTTTTADKEQVMIKVPEKKSNQLKSLNAPVSSKVRALSGVQFRNQLRDLHCFECGNAMGTQDHYKKYVECSMCRFATTCNYSYMNHMMGFHAGNQAARMASVPRERGMKQIMYCLCGYSSKYGNVIANHLVSCSKRTTYTNKPEMRFFEYDDEQEEFNPFEPYIEEPDTPETAESPKKDKEITLFDALGLVKRAPKPGLQKQGAQQKDQDPLQVIDAIAPAVDEIPPELTGGRKWSTVKLAEPKAPSKSSIFLGGNDNKDQNKKSAADSGKDEVEPVADDELKDTDTSISTSGKVKETTEKVENDDEIVESSDTTKRKAVTDEVTSADNNKKEEPIEQTLADHSQDSSSKLESQKAVASADDQTNESKPSDDKEEITSGTDVDKEITSGTDVDKEITSGTDVDKEITSGTDVDKEIVSATDVDSDKVQEVESPQDPKDSHDIPEQLGDSTAEDKEEEPEKGQEEDMEMDTSTGKHDQGQVNEDLIKADTTKESCNSQVVDVKEASSVQNLKNESSRKEMSESEAVGDVCLSEGDDKEPVSKINEKQTLDAEVGEMEKEGSAEEVKYDLEEDKKVEAEVKSGEMESKPEQKDVEETLEEKERDENKDEIVEEKANIEEINKAKEGTATQESTSAEDNTNQRESDTKYHSSDKDTKEESQSEISVSKTTERDGPASQDRKASTKTSAPEEEKESIGTADSNNAGMTSKESSRSSSSDKQSQHQKPGGSHSRHDDRRREDSRRDDSRRDGYHHKQDSHYQRDRDYYRRDDRDRHRGNRDYDNHHGGGYGGRYNDRYSGNHNDRRGSYRGNHGGGGHHQNDWRANRGGNRGRGGYYGRGGYGGYY